MASRLDRLVTLLETGSTKLIRETAAQQLADVQKAHPEDLFNLLTRVVPYLKSKNWETRTAAAKAIGGIVENAEKFDPNADDPVKHESNGSSNGVKKEEELPSPSTEEQLQLATLNVSNILLNGKRLAGTAESKYEVKLAAMDPAARLAIQKKTLTSRLGLGGDYTEEDLIDEADITAPTPGAPTPGLPRLDTSIARSDTIPGAPMSALSITEEGQLSKRQLNMLKRKSKKDAKGQANKVRIIDYSNTGRRASMAQTPSIPEPVAIKAEVKREDSDITSPGPTDYFSYGEKTGPDDNAKVVSEYKGPVIPDKSEFQSEAEEQGLEWPFERLCEYLTMDLFDADWEIRHGAAMGLREIVRVHGAGAGRLKGKSRPQNDSLNHRWLDDLTCRLCCVLMLDRFADFQFDQMNAPTRESAGQALGAVIKFLPDHLVHQVFSILYYMVCQDELRSQQRFFHACHGGMIGIKYLVLVREEQLLRDDRLMDGVLRAVMKGLVDPDDDIRIVSAATLIPLAKEFVTLRPTAINELVTIVWDCLSQLSDDLSASTGSVMDLLAKLCSFPEVLDVMKRNAATNPSQTFTELVPRLFPFLRHTITSVRSAVLRAILTFLDIEGEGTKDWINGRTLRLIFQNIVLERNEGIARLSLQVWSRLLATFNTSLGANRFAEELSPHIEAIVYLTMHPIGVSRDPIPMEPSALMRPSGQVYASSASAITQHPKSSPPLATNGEPPTKKRRRSEKKEKEAQQMSVTPHNIDAHVINGDVDLVGMEVMIRSRILAAQALGKAMALWPEVKRQELFLPKVLPHLSSNYSSTQLTACMVAEEFARALGHRDGLADGLLTTLRSMLEEERPSCYGDLCSYLRVVRSQCFALVHHFRDLNSAFKMPMIAPRVQGEPDSSSYAFSMADADKIINQNYDKWFSALTASARVTGRQQLEAFRTDCRTAMEEASRIKEQRDVRIRAAVGAAVVAFQDIPKKPATIIKSIMESVKTEEVAELQNRSASAVAKLVSSLTGMGKRNIADKIVSNLVKFCCMETAETPEFHPNSHMETGILSLKKDEDIRDAPDAARFEKEARAARITRRGAKDALEQLVQHFGIGVFEALPNLRALMESPIRSAFEGGLPANITDSDNPFGQEVVDAFSAIRALLPKFDKGLYPFVISLFPCVVKALQCRLSVLRYAAAKCLATICSVITVEGITMLVKEVLPSISNPIDVHHRQGAIEVIYHLIHVMEDRILPYVIFLIVPVLGRMSDSDNDVRLIATTTFATLVKLVPLEAGIPDPPGLSEELLKGRDRERQFIAQMLDVHKVEPFQIPVAIKAELRSYQQEGVNWLAFLNRYHLHGILCDDMGLGKTLQTITIVASDHYLRAEEFAKTQAPDMRRLPSLIVCPPTLSGHWVQEIKQFAPFLTVTAYVGPPQERAKRRAKLGTTDIVITSYDIMRNDVEILAPMNWNYCVLDEGHLIKNPASKITQACKRLISNHRLILSGTPIQNNVLELWSLFDYLMPGFLGSEKVFNERFSKPIQRSRFSKSSSKEQEAGALAIEALHKQVLPFLLRRLKEEVLNDLPPKIIQNYYCDLSELQKKLFDDFNRKQGKELTEKAQSGDKEAKAHIFQALQYMRKLCNSPALVMKENHKQYGPIQQYLQSKGTDLKDPVHAPKLSALKDLLVECGIGHETSSNKKDNVEEASNMEAVSPHRALIFCQMKEMLDMVQETVLKRMLPMVQYMRLDGSVEANKRQEIVNKFNSDPSYDVLLLTTSVGGLGLNLTGADTVIFVEHDWNPQKDMQAMDRAHRIGQKKVVNVYRLITRGTLEEKIMSLQRFKIDIASTVVNQQNAGLASMGTDQILDLFNVSATDAASSDDFPASTANGGGDEHEAVDAVTGEVKEKGKKGFLDDLGELWEESQYQEEYDLDGFLRSMRG